MEKNRSLQAESFLLAITLIWGGTFILIKNALLLMPPFLFTACRFGVAGLLSLLLFGRYLRGLTSRDMQHGIVLGLLYGMGFFMQTIGLQYTTVGKSSFITGSLVLIVPFAYRIIEHRRITLFQKLGVAIATIGLWVFTNPTLNNINYGDMLTLGSAALWAFYIVYLDVFTRDSDRDSFALTGRLVLVQFAVTFVMALVGAVILEPLRLPASVNVLGAVLYTAIFATVLATVVQTHYQHRTTPVKAALIYALEPIFASIIAVLFSSEPFGVREITGGLLVVSGVLTAETGDALLQNFQRRGRQEE